MYGSSLFKSSNVVSEIKRMLAVCVSLEHVYFQNVYNLFKNNAFISYSSNYKIPTSDDFILSFSFTPDTINSDDIYIMSEGSSFTQEPIVKIYYNNTNGLVFSATPDVYVDGLGLVYVDDNNEPYYSNEGSIYLSGGSINVNESNTVKITKTGTTYSLYVNDVLVDTTISDKNIGGGETTNLYLGVYKNQYYNSGSINNLYIYNSAESNIILNDNLNKQTNLGINNGVLFL